MRSEKRNRFLALLMALVLLFSVPAVWLRVQAAGNRVSTNELMTKVTGNQTGAYLDRTGGVILESGDPVPDVVGNLFGFSNYVDNAVIPAYSDQLGPTRFNRITGVRSLVDQKGSALVTTLLPLSSQEALANAFYDESSGRLYNGAVFAYNYTTGEIYTMISVPSIGSVSDDMTENSSFNKVLKGTFTPGSTMKVVAMLCALEQSELDLDSFRFNCDGRSELPDGNAVTCGYAHGNGLRIEDALGLSCNGFISAMSAQFNIEEACTSLQRMGFNTQLAQVPQQYVDALARSSSSTVFTDPNSFSSRWAFPGQGQSVVSCIDMAMIAGAAANGGQAAEPHLVQHITNLETGKESHKANTTMKQLFSKDTATKADAIWTAACTRYYRLSCDAITNAKTGTAENGDGTTSRSLIGTMESYDTSFFIYVEGLRSGDNRCVQIAGVLAEELSKYQ